MGPLTLNIVFLNYSYESLPNWYHFTPRCFPLSSFQKSTFFNKKHLKHPVTKTLPQL